MLHNVWRRALHGDGVKPDFSSIRLCEHQYLTTDVFPMINAALLETLCRGWSMSPMRSGSSQGIHSLIADQSGSIGGKLAGFQKKKIP